MIFGKHVDVSWIFTEQQKGQHIIQLNTSRRDTKSEAFVRVLGLIFTSTNAQKQMLACQNEINKKDLSSQHRSSQGTSFSISYHVASTGRKPPEKASSLILVSFLDLLECFHPFLQSLSISIQLKVKCSCLVLLTRLYLVSHFVVLMHQTQMFSVCLCLEQRIQSLLANIYDYERIDRVYLMTVLLASSTRICTT